MGYIDHAVRRGLDHPSTISLLKRAVENGPEMEIPKWGLAILATTLIVFLFFMSALEYTLKDVIATLTMVETPAAAITVSPSKDLTAKDTREPLLETGPTVTLVHQKPITSSIRGTIRHLVSTAGTWSRWRGIMSFIVYNLSFSVVANIFDVLVPQVPGRLVLITGITGALLANLHATWTHKVISMPTNKRLLSRIPSRANWKLLAFPAAVEASAGYLSVYIAQGFIILFGLNTLNNDNFAEYTCREWTSVVLRMLAIFTIILSCGLFIVLPALVTQIRVEASILPEDDDTIVPFDRTFAGKVVPKILGGTGAIGFLDAWRSFNWEARRRLIKLYAKIFVIATALFVVLAHVIAFEAWAIMGPALGKFLARAREQGHF
ncbi:hypothetical protein K469DRAFT_712598 [Zopfia rhizophila CBS 207.26]|uniref:Ubiquitin conjugating enzyme n=1 Tax=Zopfia rhizophila CBS 207.26 TaxID=1314779 RepID=A0A6A6ER78_9PEZI|nr:hypothetical protein K469DRAFT_712598 [Zopfia rhizophila CBS 207.26]